MNNVDTANFDPEGRPTDIDRLPRGPPVRIVETRPVDRKVTKIVLELERPRAGAGIPPFIFMISLNPDRAASVCELLEWYQSIDRDAAPADLRERLAVCDRLFRGWTERICVGEVEKSMQAFEAATTLLVSVRVLHSRKAPDHPIPEEVARRGFRVVRLMRPRKGAPLVLEPRMARARESRRCATGRHRGSRRSAGVRSSQDPGEGESDPPGDVSTPPARRETAGKVLIGGHR